MEENSTTSLRRHASKEPLLKILLLNVHMWMDASFQSNKARVASFVRDQEPHLVLFNEVSAPGRAALESVLENHQSLIAPAQYGIGNSISLRNNYSNQNVNNSIKCNQLSVLQLERPPHGEHFKSDRSALKAEVEWTLDSSSSSSPIKFTAYCTHLDHEDEDTRIEQMDSLMMHVNRDVPHIICGDMNALTKEDYSPAEAAHIALVRDNNCWEPPRFELTQLMRSRGYVDCYRKLNPDTKDRHCATSRFGTRIDYIWMSADFALRIDWAKSRCILRGDDTLSDHRAMILSLVALPWS